MARLDTGTRIVFTEGAAPLVRGLREEPLGNLEAVTRAVKRGQVVQRRQCAGPRRTESAARGLDGLDGQTLGLRVFPLL
jgi:hypothetical protein